MCLQFSFKWFWLTNKCTTFRSGQHFIGWLTACLQVLIDTNIVAKSLRRSNKPKIGVVLSAMCFMCEAFITYIRPMLEYNSMLFSPLMYFIGLFESVQREFTKRMTSLSSVSYSKRLSILNLQALELRLLHSDITDYYKILNSLRTEYFITYNPMSSTWSTMPSLQKPLLVNCHRHFTI